MADGDLRAHLRRTGPARSLRHPVRSGNAGKDHTVLQSRNAISAAARDELRAQRKGIRGGVSRRTGRQPHDVGSHDSQGAGRSRRSPAPGHRVLAAGLRLPQRQRLAAAARLRRRHGCDAVPARLTRQRLLAPPPLRPSVAEPARARRTGCARRAGGLPDDAGRLHVPRPRHGAPDERERNRPAAPGVSDHSANCPARRATTRPTPWLDEFAEAIGGRRQTTYTADGVELALPGSG